MCYDEPQHHSGISNKSSEKRRTTHAFSRSGNGSKDCCSTHMMHEKYWFGTDLPSTWCERTKCVSSDHSVSPMINRHSYQFIHTFLSFISSSSSIKLTQSNWQLEHKPLVLCWSSGRIVEYDCACLCTSEHSTLTDAIDRGCASCTENLLVLIRSSAIQFSVLTFYSTCTWWRCVAAISCILLQIISSSLIACGTSNPAVYIYHCILLLAFAIDASHRMGNYHSA